MNKLQVASPNVILLLLLGLAAYLAVPAQAATIGLEVTLRDFSSSHPDFQQGIIRKDPGFVGSALSDDRKPVYVGGHSTLTTHGAATFDQWFRDVPGVNLTTTETLTLSNDESGAGGVYSFSDKKFFPIDGQLLGNEGRSHNYHFTLELHAQFMYEPGQTFKFTTDDDLFVFINDTLIVDLGGVHPTRHKTIDLDTLSLTAGQMVDFDLFYAERQATKAKLSFQTGVALQSIPEPGAVALLGLGCITKALRRRRK